MLNYTGLQMFSSKLFVFVNDSGKNKLCKELLHSHLYFCDLPSRFFKKYGLHSVQACLYMHMCFSNASKLLCSTLALLLAVKVAANNRKPKINT